MSKIIITRKAEITSKKTGDKYIAISFVNVGDGSVGESLFDASVFAGFVLDGDYVVDVKELENIAVDCEFNQRGKIVHLGS